jgi:uroporphyrinogen decarboxylase
MQPCDRVTRTLQGLAVDRVPRGELIIAPAFCCRVLQTEDFSFELALQFWELLQLDLVVLAAPNEQLHGADLGGGELVKNIRRWRRETDYYIFALVNGGFARTFTFMGFQRFMEAAVRQKSVLLEMIQRFTGEALMEAEAAVNAGAYGIIIADDVAYNKGTYLSPAHLRELYFSPLREQLEKFKSGVHVFFHSDGNINRVLPDLVNAGFSGLQGLEPGAGMDLAEVKAAYGTDLCLMGNMDLSLLDPAVSEEELRGAVYQTMRAGKEGGRYIFGTCGGLHRDLDVGQVLDMYRFALAAGKY